MWQRNYGEMFPLLTQCVRMTMLCYRLYCNLIPVYCLSQMNDSLQITEDKLTYKFTLIYNPSPLLDTPIVRTNEATVAVECIYPR